MKRNAPSTSAVLEEILLTARQNATQKAVEGAVAGYYSSLSTVEVDEHANWGGFALSEFPNEVA